MGLAFWEAWYWQIERVMGTRLCTTMYYVEDIYEISYKSLEQNRIYTLELFSSTSHSILRRGSLKAYSSSSFLLHISSTGPDRTQYQVINKL